MELNTKTSVLALAVIAIAGGVGFFVAIYTTPLGGTTPVATAPQANLDCNHHPANNSLTIRHSNGETFKSSGNDTVALEVYAFPDTEERPSEPTTIIDLPFSPGDTATLTGVNNSDRVVVIWVRNSHSEIVGDCSDQLSES